MKLHTFKTDNNEANGEDEDNSRCHEDYNQDNDNNTDEYYCLCTIVKMRKKVMKTISSSADDQFNQRRLYRICLKIILC